MPNSQDIDDADGKARRHVRRAPADVLHTATTLIDRAREFLSEFVDKALTMRSTTWSVLTEPIANQMRPLVDELIFVRWMFEHRSSYVATCTR